MVAFTVIGTPAPQGSKIRTRWGVRDDNPATKPWRANVAGEAAAAWHGNPLISGPVEVDATFVFPRPKSHFGTGRSADTLKPSAPLWHATKPDGDKLARAIGDALTGVVLRDDSLIVAWKIRKVYGAPARAYITIRPADAGDAAGAAFEAQYLSRQALVSP